jgi:hypothetical protein
LTDPHDLCCAASFSLVRLRVHPLANHHSILHTYTLTCTHPPTHPQASTHSDSPSASAPPHLLHTHNSLRHMLWLGGKLTEVDASAFWQNATAEPPNVDHLRSPTVGRCSRVQKEEGGTSRHSGSAHVYSWRQRGLGRCYQVGTGAAPDVRPNRNRPDGGRARRRHRCARCRTLLFNSRHAMHLPPKLYHPGTQLQPNVLQLRVPVPFAGPTTFWHNVDHPKFPKLHRV